jgi:hypothetical protein
MDIFYGNNQRVAQWLLEPEARAFIASAQQFPQVHYFDALNTKPSSDNDEFHDALEQFADDPDSVIDLIVYRLRP